MEKNRPEMDGANGCSTYGLLTAQRLFERFHLQLNEAEIKLALTHPRSVYHQLLRIPLKNVFNGIIFHQAYDYQVYAQKLFVDYFLSGEADKDNNQQGENTRDSLEQERAQLITLGEAFTQKAADHQRLIAVSQSKLIALSEKLRDAWPIAVKQVSDIIRAEQGIKNEGLIEPALRAGILTDDLGWMPELSTGWVEFARVLNISLNEALWSNLAHALAPWREHQAELQAILDAHLEAAEDMSVSFRGFRSEFYNSVLRGTELITLLPDYHEDKARIDQNRTSLMFDPTLGE